MNLFAFTLCIGAVFAAPSVRVRETYTYESTLGTNGSFVLRWTPDVANNLISMELEAATTGWVGVTFLPPLAVGKFADTIFAGVDATGELYIQDRYTDTSIAEPNTPRPLDVQQDWTIHYGQEIDGKTIVGVSRPLDTADPEDNPAIRDQSLVFTWAFDDKDLVEGEPLFHGPSRGGILLNLINPDLSVVKRL